jgi:hypothetical protein
MIYRKHPIRSLLTSMTENSILKFLTVSSVSSDSIVKGIIDDIIKTAVKTAKVDEQKTKYLQHLQQTCQIKQIDWMIYRKHPIRSLLTSMLRNANIRYPSDVCALSFEKYKGK